MKECPFAKEHWVVGCDEKCALYDKENKRCAILSIAKSLDRLHNSQIKPSIKGD